METQLPQSNSPEPKKSWFTAHHALGYLLVFLAFAAVVSGIYYWQTTDAIPDRYEPIVDKDPTADWKTYTNTEYGFEFKYPSEFFISGVLVSESNGQKAFYLKNGLDTLAIFPGGEFDRGITDETIREESIILSGYNAEKEIWQIGNEYVTIIHFTEKIPSWSLLFNRIEVRTSKNQSMFDQILSTFKFIE